MISVKASSPPSAARVRRMPKAPKGIPTRAVVSDAGGACLAASVEVSRDGGAGLTASREVSRDGGAATVTVATARVVPLTALTWKLPADGPAVYKPCGAIVPPVARQLTGTAEVGAAPSEGAWWARSVRRMVASTFVSSSAILAARKSRSGGTSGVASESAEELPGRLAIPLLPAAGTSRRAREPVRDGREGGLVVRS